MWCGVAIIGKNEQILEDAQVSIIKNIKPFFVKEIALTFTMTLASASALACTCNENNVEAVAYINDMVLTRLKVSSPSITERILSLLPTKNHSRVYSVQVIESYKNLFTASTISVDTNVGYGGCGANISYGETINVVAYKDSEGIISNHVGICNIVSDGFAEKVRKKLNTPNEDYNSVDTNSWLQFHKSNTQTFYADIKHVTRDKNGAYIWVVMNDTTTNVKSQKTRLHIACKEKMFTIDHEVGFNDYNASGKVLAAINFGKNEQYQWLPLTDSYSKLLTYTC